MRLLNRDHPVFEQVSEVRVEEGTSGELVRQELVIRVLRDIEVSLVFPPSPMAWGNG